MWWRGKTGSRNETLSAESLSMSEGVSAGWGCIRQYEGALELVCGNKINGFHCLLSPEPPTCWPLVGEGNIETCLILGEGADARVMIVLPLHVVLGQATSEILGDLLYPLLPF